MEKELNVCNPQVYAVSIEHSLRRVFRCDRGGLGGMVDADYIRSKPFSSIMCGLTYLYATANGSKRKMIEDYFEYHSYYADMTLDYLLSFEASEKVVDGGSYGIDFENGEKAVESMIEKFEGIVKS